MKLRKPSTEQSSSRYPEKELNKKTEAQRRWREKIKQNEAKHEEAKRKDRERKKLRRMELKKQMKADKRLEKSVREKKKLEMRKYRAKKVEPKNEGQDNNEWEDEEVIDTCVRDISSNRKLQSSNRKWKTLQRENERVKTMNKRMAVITTQKWRMKIKMQSKNKDEEETDTIPMFKCRQTEYRAVKRARQNLPVSPKKRAAILKKLAESPTTNKLLAKQNILILKHV